MPPISPHNAPLQKQTLRSLDLLKIISLAGVLYSHLVGQWVLPLGNNSWSIHDVIILFFFNPLRLVNYGGTIAVCFYLLIEGFLYEQSQHTTSLSPLSWLKKRILALYPLFWISLIVESFLRPSFSGFTLFSFPDFIFHFTLLNYLFPLNETFNGVCWFLFIVVLHDILATLLRCLTHSRFMALSVLQGILLFLIASYIYLPPLLQVITVYLGYSSMIMVARALYFLWDKSKPSSMKEIISLFTSLSLMYLSYFQFFRTKTPEQELYLVSMIYATLFFMLLISIESHLLHTKQDKLPYFFSKMTRKMLYAIYLFHNPLANYLLPVLLTSFSFPHSLALTLLSIFCFSFVVVFLSTQAFKASINLHQLIRTH